MDRSFDPLWNQKLYRAFDGYLIATGKKRDYLTGLKDRLQKNPLDADATTRLFHAYHLAGNVMEAQNSLNDFRLLKEQKVREKKSSWSSKELFWMASLHQRILNYNEAARYYYALYGLLSYKKETSLQPDTALHGLFQVLLAAEDRPVQISAGNLDYYKDIAAMDQNPGILNGILSLILNGTDPSGELQFQEDKANGYNNRAEAMRLLRFTQKHFPDSPLLPGMYRDSLRIYEKYGMDRLLVEAGEEFFKQFRNSPELLEVGIAVTDAYARLKDNEKEWRTYQSLLPIAAERRRGSSLMALSPDSSEEGDYSEDQPKTQVDYQFLLNRYIASLAARDKHLEVVRLYQQEIAQHPAEEALYENFATYLSQNQLFEEERKLYEQAINRFQDKGWYEKLARWYLRFKQENEYEKLSKQVMDIFRGTEIESYLQQTSGSSHQLYIALNLYAHQKFPLNLHFVRNLLSHYDQARSWEQWEALAEEYYFLDESIRQQYLKYLSSRKRLPTSPETSNAIYTRFAGDLAAWKSHFEEAATHYEQLGKNYPGDAEINLRLADLKRSLGVQDLQNYLNAAAIREHLAKINPSDSALWTTAGETMADIERYDESRKYWNQILPIDPYHPDRYIEVATIYWDYYLFDDALNTIAKIRALKKEETLFAYEAGAIYESKRDYKNAITEYARSLADHSEMAWSRLAQLHERKRFRNQIREYLDAQLQKEPQNERIWTGTIRFYSDQKQKELLQTIIAKALETLKPEPFRNVAETLKQYARDSGFNDLQEKLLNRQIADSVSDLERWNKMLELVRFYEAKKKANQAETVYLRLYKEQPRSAGLIQELLSYYWRSEQHSKAFAVYKDALAAANPVWRKKYSLEVAGKYRERKDFTSALAYARDLLNTEALNSQYFRLVVELLAEQKDYVSLAAHYKDGLKRVQEANLSADEKRERTAELRRGMIEAQVILKDYTAALDQYIEIINRDAESEEILKGAAGFAERYGLSQRLLDYYTKTAAASPKDHRWPMVLGRLYLYTGNFQNAIQQFQTAITIRPERTDFYQQVAESFQRLGQYEEAIRQYDRAYEISFKNKRWLMPMAELYARLGQEQKALELCTESLKDLAPLQRNFTLTRQSLAWGFHDRAVIYGKAALDLYFKDMSAPFQVAGFQDYLEALIRSGKRAESFSVLRQTSARIAAALRKATFESEQLRSAQYMVRDTCGNRYPELIRRYFLDEDWQMLHQAIFDHIAQNGGYSAMQEPINSEILPMVRTARMAPAEERILQELAKDNKNRSPKQAGEEWSKYMQWHRQLISFYSRRHAYTQGAEWMEAEWNTYRIPQDHRDDLVRIAELFRLAELQEREITALRKYYRFGMRYDLQPPAVQRYLDLLYQTNRTEELKQAAATANLISANYFLQKNDKLLSIIAIQALHSRFKNDPSWQSIQLAMVGWQMREASDFFDRNFQTALDLRPIGAMLEQHSDVSKTLEGDVWFYYTKSYGEYLHRTARKDQAVYYLPADLEGLPTSGARQDQLGSFYSREREPENALQHFSLALQLDDENLLYLDHRARALMELGKKEEAINLWKSIVANEEHRTNLTSWHLFLQAAVDFGFLPSVGKDIEDYISSRVRDTGDGGSSHLIELYLRNIDQSSKMEQVQKWIKLAPAPFEFGQSLLAYKLSTEVDLQIYSAVNEYLQSRLLTATGQEQGLVRNDFWRWNQIYAKTLLDLKSYAQAVEILSRAQERFESTEEIQTRYAIVLLRSRTLALSGKPEEGWQLLPEYLKPSDTFDEMASLEERYRSAVETLKGTALENRLKEEMYTWLLSSGRTEDSSYVGLAEVKLQNSKREEAKELLRKMIYLRSDNLDGFHLAAELLEKYKYWEDALELRKELAKRKPWDPANRARLAVDSLQLEQKLEAAKLAAQVVIDPSATAPDRSIAAKVYGEASNGFAGPAEMIAIEKAVRGRTMSAEKSYAHNLRTILSGPYSVTSIDFDPTGADIESG